MVVVDFNMCFTFLSIGWEGSMHDSRIFAEIINNENVPFSYLEEGIDNCLKKIKYVEVWRESL